MGNPNSYKDCIRYLNENGYLEDEISEKVNKMIGLRNLLVHDYIDIELAELYRLLNNFNEFDIFSRQVKEDL